MLGIARENLLLAYRQYLRQQKLAEVSWANKRAVVAAGVYEDPIPSLNEATSEYLDKIDLSVDLSIRKRQQSNQELYEEWKAIFGKIEE